MAFADDVAALTAQAQQLTTDTQQAQANLQAALDAIPDLTGLKGAIGDLNQAVASAEALKASVPPAPAPAPTPEPAPTPDPTPIEALSVYTFAGDPATIDAAQWPASGLETIEGPPRLLYHYAGDTQPGDTNGNGLDGGAWEVFTGPTQPVPAA